MTGNDVFILEDDGTMRAMLKAVLEKAGYEPIFFADGDALLAKARGISPACVLLDLCLPGRSGLDILRELGEEDYAAPILMVSGQGDIPTAVRALRIGAADFVEKPFRPADLIERMERAGAGRKAATSPIEAFKASRKLTPRERQVLDHLLEGLSNKSIARILNVSPRTIEEHRNSIMKKAGVRTVTQLAIAVFETKRALSASASAAHA